MAQVRLFKNIDRISCRNTQLPDEGKFIRLPLYYVSVNNANGIKGVNWARTRQRWFRQQWNSVVFSDESRFTLHRRDGRVRVYRRRTERYTDCCVLERDRFGGGGSVLVWVAIARGFRTNLVVIEWSLNAQGYRDEIPARHFISLLQNNANITLFQHDNATSHTARDTVNFLRANFIAFMNDWPAKSPDLNLNPIERL